MCFFWKILKRKNLQLLLRLKKYFEVKTASQKSNNECSQMRPPTYLDTLTKKVKTSVQNQFEITADGWGSLIQPCIISFGKSRINFRGLVCIKNVRLLLKKILRKNGCFLNLLKVKNMRLLLRIMSTHLRKLFWSEKQIKIKTRWKHILHFRNPLFLCISG